MKLNLFGKTFELNIKNNSSTMPTTLDNDSRWNDYLKAKGYTIDHNTALNVAVVIRCADVVAKTMASLGCHLYIKSKDGRIKDENHNIHKLIRLLPNPETTSYEFWHMYIFNLMLTKGAYAKIVRDGSGFIKELWNIPTSNVTMNRNPITKERYIDVCYSFNSHEKLQGERIYEENFMYTPGLRFGNEETPQDFITIASDVLGLTVNLNRYAKDYFENGSNLGGWVVYPGRINETAFQKFKEEWQKKYSSVINQHKWAILEGGFDVRKMDSNPENAQALESRKFQVIEICRIFGIPPHKVFSMEGVNYNSIEQSNIEYVQETLGPMNERLCQTIYKNLLSQTEQINYYAKFNINKLLQGDMRTRTAYYQTMRQNGVFSANDILTLEDMNSISDDEGGNIRLVNGNLIPLSIAKDNKTNPMKDGANNA